MTQDEDLVRKFVAACQEPVAIDRAEAARRFAALRDKPLVIIGTSGSSDYLRDTGTKRYWPVTVAVEGREVCDGLSRGDLSETQDARDHEEEMD